jgi:membrane-associated phospholipid phosphatase
VTKLDARPGSQRGSSLAATRIGERARQVGRELDTVDRAVYQTIGAVRTPVLDASMARLSNAANYSRLWLGCAAVMAAIGGRQARRAAFLGVVSIGLSSVISNIVVKPLLARARPQRDAAVVPSDRWVRMPTSSSLPSGHSASAFAFATAVGYELPALSIPLRVVAAAVAYSRIHTGVHYPGDAVAGSVVGASAAQIVTRMVGDRRRRSRVCPPPTDQVSLRPARPAFRRP